MADRKRSTDGERETEKFTHDEAAPHHQNRSQGGLERQVGTRDEAKQAVGDGGATRVRKEDEQGQGRLGGHHGTGKGKT